MTTYGFMEEIAQFIESAVPAASYHREKTILILNIPVSGKTVAFISNQPTPGSSSEKYDYCITELMWHTNQEAVKSRIYSLLKITKRIHGRACKVIKISKKEARDFVNTNHLMGYAFAHYNYALLLNNHLVAVACFSKGRKMNRLPNNKKSFELIRFCNKNYFTVVGGLSKLIRHFENEISPGDIMTYVDEKWGQPHSYYALGFELEPQNINPKTKTLASNPVINEVPSNIKLIKHLCRKPIIQ